jgi:hypothetical protein
MYTELVPEPSKNLDPAGSQGSPRVKGAYALPRRPSSKRNG